MCLSKGLVITRRPRVNLFIFDEMRVPKLQRAHTSTAKPHDLVLGAARLPLNRFGCGLELWVCVLQRRSRRMLSCWRRFYIRFRDRDLVLPIELYIYLFTVYCKLSSAL